MPVITIEMWKGRTDEEKEKLIKNVTKAVAESFDIKEEWIHVIIHDAPKQNWGIAGKQASKMEFKEK